MAEAWFGGLRAQPRRWALLVFVASLLAWPLLATMFSALFRGTCALAISPLTFGTGGHVSFTHAPHATGLERAASWDVHMVLSVEGVEKAHSIALNPRRLLYLPLSTLLAGVLAMPLPRAARARAFGVGGLLLLTLALGSVWLTATFLFAQVPGLVYDLSPTESGLLRVLYEGWVTPLTNKFMLPLLLAYGLFAWQRRRVESAASAPAAASANAAQPLETIRSAKHKRRSGRQHRRSTSARS